MAAAYENKDGYIVVPFYVTKGTSYCVYARLNCAKANVVSYWVKLDNGEFVKVNGLATKGWQWLKIASFGLTAGNHTFTIAYREDGAKLDKLCITNDKDIPTGTGKPVDVICVFDIPDLILQVSN